MNITLTGTKITQDNKFLAFEKNNGVDVINITVDTDNEWAYKLDVCYPDKCCAGGGKPLYNIINLTRNGNICTAILTSDMLPFSGKYAMQLRAINNDKVAHSDIFDCWVKYSIEPASTYDPIPSEFYQIEQNITEMNNHPPKPGENGYWLIWDITTHQYKESAISLPEGTLPDITADTSGKYLSNDGKKAYWAEVQAGEENKIDKIEVNGIEQPIVDKTVNIAVPTKTSDLSNDSGYITNEALEGYATKADLPTKVSQLENDSKFINESALDGYAKTADIPTKTSQLNNDSGYITANDVPVKSVDGATGDVVTNAVKTTAQTLTDAQKQQARTNIGAGTSSFDGDYNSLTNKPTIPTKTSDITNDSGFITEADIPVKSVNGKTGEVTLDAKAVGALPDTTVIPSKTSELDNDSGYITELALEPYAKTENVPTKTSELTNDSGFITNAALDGYAKTIDVPTKVSQLENDSAYITSSGAPVQSVNGKTGTVVLDAASVGALPDTTTIPSKTSELDNDSGFITNDALSGKQDKIIGAATTITNSNLTANCALISDANGKVAVSDVTSTELSYLDGVTSNVQTQLNSKQGVDDEIQGLRLRGGINSIINNASAVSINPAVNAAGFLRYNGGNVQIFYDGILMPFQNWEIDILFDGKSGTNLNFGRGPSNAQTACLWSETTNYPQNARVMYQTTSGVFRWYKALKESKGVTPEGDSTGAWEDASSSRSPSMMDVRNLEVSIVIDSNLVLKWENGASFYWRAAKQNCRYYKIEIYDSITNQYVLVAERDNIPIDEVVNTQYMGVSVDGVGKRVRITFRAQSNEDTGWFAVTQIAFTGIIGGIEGTLVNRGGSTMYGNLSPYKSGGASLGTSLARWNEVHANKVYGDGSNLTNLPIDGLPAVTTADNGKVLCVVNGKWEAVTLPST